jgi:TolB-like protein
MRKTMILLAIPFLLVSAPLFAETGTSLRVAVLDIVSRIPPDVMQTGVDTAVFSESLLTELVKTGQVTVLEREGLVRILSEQKLQLSGLTEEDATRVGKLAGAETVIYGSLSKLEGLYILTVKAVDVSTGTVQASDQEKAYTLNGVLADIPDTARALIAGIVKKGGHPDTSTESSLRQDSSSSAAASTAVTHSAAATEENVRWFPLQFSLWESLQIVPKNYDINGFSLSCVLSANRSVIGLDAGLATIAEKNIVGAQLGIFEWTKGTVYGAQLGIVNIAENVYGAQIGLVNWTEKMEGVQIGIVNIIRDGWISFIPIVNMHF